MVITTYLLEKYNIVVVPWWVICTLFLSPVVGFLYERPAPPYGHLQLFQNKMTNARQMPRGGMGILGID